MPELEAPDEARLRAVYKEQLPKHLVVCGVYALRVLVAAVVESLLVCDRALYLEETLPETETKRISVAPLFDPALSPRTLAITAYK